MHKFKTIELFAGCGGLLDGFEKTKYYSTLACVEWNKKPSEVLIKRLSNKYKYKNASDKVLCFDIQRTEELINGWTDDIEYGSGNGLISIVKGEKIDLIVGGPPCQAYSLAGRIQDKEGMRNDYRNYLFESYLKIVDIFKPKVIVFENVEGILSARPGGISIIDRIVENFNSSGYEITKDIRGKALLDLSEFGVPQKRKRVILIGLNKDFFSGNLQDSLNHFYDDILSKYKTKIKLTVRDAIMDLPKLLPAENEYYINGKKYSHLQHESEILDHNPRYHNKRDIGIFKELALDIELGLNKYRNSEKLKELYTLKTGKISNVHKYNVLKWDEPSNTIPAHLKKDGLRHIHPDSTQARTITVREAARIQTFEDGYKFSENMTTNYEMIGNAVPPEFSFRLASALHDFLIEKGLDN